MLHYLINLDCQVLFHFGSLIRILHPVSVNDLLNLCSGNDAFFLNDILELVPGKVQLELFYKLNLTFSCNYIVLTIFKYWVFH